MPRASCSCGCEYNFKSIHTGRRGVCPKCKGIILLVDAFDFDASKQSPEASFTNKIQTGWSFRHNGAIAIVDRGPFSKAEMLKAINCGEVLFSTPVWHPEDTRGIPVLASSVDWINAAIEERARIIHDRQKTKKEAQKREIKRLSAILKKDTKRISTVVFSFAASIIASVESVLIEFGGKFYFWGLFLFPVGLLCIPIGVFSTVFMSLSIFFLFLSFITGEFIELFPRK